jgi:putative membrane protein
MMPHSHGAHHGHEGGAGGLVLLGVVMLAAAVYLVLALRLRGGRRPWSKWRTRGFLLGSAMVGVALFPPLVPFPEGDFREHMLQHLLIGMVAPVLLVLAAPITLVLRSLPTRYARGIARLLRRGPVYVIANPAVALVLNIGGMAALYFTPLYAAMSHSAALHLFIHVHFLAAGCLFAWVIAGPDPAPHRPSVPARLVVLGVAIAAHATLSQLMYAGLFVSAPVPAHELRGGAELMYYGGDIAELLLAFGLMSTWRPRRSPSRAAALQPLRLPTA